MSNAAAHQANKPEGQEGMAGQIALMIDHTVMSRMKTPDTGVSFSKKATNYTKLPD